MSNLTRDAGDPANSSMTSSAPPSTPTATAADGEQRMVSALARGISILRCFTSARQELSARELMESTGLPKPTLLRLLDTLNELGLLNYSERMSKYQVGVSVLNMAAPALARMTARQLARPLMEDLADHIQGQVQMSVGWRRELVYVEVVQGKGSQLYRPDAGMRLSLSRTASGRAYLCRMPETERRAFLEELAARDRPHHDWLVDRLMDAESDLAEHGFCRGHRDLHRENDVIATPVTGTQGEEQIVVSAAVAVFSPQSKQFVEDVGPRLVSLVRNVQGALGDRS